MNETDQGKHFDHRTEVSLALPCTLWRTQRIGKLFEAVAAEELRLPIQIFDSGRVPLPGDEAKVVQSLLAYAHTARICKYQRIRTGEVNIVRNKLKYLGWKVDSFMALVHRVMRAVRLA